MGAPISAVREAESEASPEPTAERSERGADGRVVCPLCGVATDDESAVYVHLQTSHRKSALAGLVVGKGK